MEIDSTGFFFLADAVRVAGVVLALVGLGAFAYLIYDQRQSGRPFDNSSYLNLGLALVAVVGGVILFIARPALALRFYGVIIVTGAVVGAYISTLEARRKDENPDYVWDGLLYALIGGIIGARLYYLFTLPTTAIGAERSLGYYLDSPERILFVWEGGLHIFGAVIGGVVGLFIFTRVQKLNFLTWVDIAAPALLIAQAIGRWANYINQELYGPPTDLPWGIYIEPAYRVPQFLNSEYFHPLFLYESLLNIAAFVGLMYLVRRYRDWFKPGDAFLVYLILYPLIRAAVEFLRLDSPTLGNLNITQAISVLIAVVAGIILIVRHNSGGRRPRRRSQTAAETVEFEEPITETEAVADIAETTDEAAETDIEDETTRAT